jgi:light-regulated signal transduction histidine kinase (bacteriophytochrome)
MGVNLPGVEVILRMMERMNEMQYELEQAHEELRKYGEGE